MRDDIDGESPFLPEKPEDSGFLLDLPEDFDFYEATVRAEQLIGSLTGKFNLHLLSAIKESLRMPIIPVNRSATTVILNVIEETKKMCGFASPEVIFSLLKQRREQAKKPSDK